MSTGVPAGGASPESSRSVTLTVRVMCTMSVGKLVGGYCALAPMATTVACRVLPPLESYVMSAGLPMRTPLELLARDVCVDERPLVGPDADDRCADDHDLARGGRLGHDARDRRNERGLVALGLGERDGDIGVVGNDPGDVSRVDDLLLGGGKRVARCCQLARRRGERSRAGLQCCLTRRDGSQTGVDLRQTGVHLGEPRVDAGEQPLELCDLGLSARAAPRRAGTSPPAV